MHFGTSIAVAIVQIMFRQSFSVHTPSKSHVSGTFKNDVARAELLISLRSSDDLKDLLAII